MTQIDELRLPPHSIEAEQSVIGALLMYPDAFDRIDWLQESAFFSGGHRAIFRAQRSLIETGKPADTLLVMERMRADGTLEDAGGRSYIGSLAVNTPSAANIHRYAAIVRDKALLRGLMTHAKELTDAANLPGADARALAEQADAQLTEILQCREDSEAKPYHQALDEALLARQRTDEGITTGYTDVDRLIGPLQSGNLVIVAARPSMGKSGCLGTIGEHVGATLPAYFASLEMSRALIAERGLVNHERRIGHDRALEKLAALKLHIDTPSSLTVGSLRLKLRRHKRKHGLALALVDYLQLMKGDGDNRTQEVGSISRGLKQLAVELEIPIVVACQLNRAVENRTDRRPLLSDLRESGDIEQDADIVLMLYRDDYYNANSDAAGTAEVIVRKHRNGRTGMARLTFIEEGARFENYAGPPIIRAAPARRTHTGTVSAPDFKSRAAGD